MILNLKYTISLGKVYLLAGKFRLDPAALSNHTVKSISWAEPADPLMRSSEIVAPDIIRDPLHRLTVAVKSDPSQAFSFDRLDQTLHLTLALRTVRLADNMFDLLIVKILLKQRLTRAPAEKSAALVGQKLTGYSMTDTAVVQNTDQALCLLVVA